MRSFLRLLRRPFTPDEIRRLELLAVGASLLLIVVGVGLFLAASDIGLGIAALGFALLVWTEILAP